MAQHCKGSNSVSAIKKRKNNGCGLGWRIHYCTRCDHQYWKQSANLRELTMPKYDFTDAVQNSEGEFLWCVGQDGGASEDASVFYTNYFWAKTDTDAKNEYLKYVIQEKNDPADDPSEWITSLDDLRHVYCELISPSNVK